MNESGEASDSGFQALGDALEAKNIAVSKVKDAVYLFEDVQSRVVMQRVVDAAVAALQGGVDADHVAFFVGDILPTIARRGWDQDKIERGEVVGAAIDLAPLYSLMDTYDQKEAAK